MKKLIFLILITNLSFAQCRDKDGAPVHCLLNKEVVTGNNQVFKNIYVNDGSDNLVKVDLYANISIQEFKKLGDYTLDDMIKETLLKAKFSLKNTYTFIPRDVTIKKTSGLNEQYGFWQVNIGFSAQNDFGALKDGNYTIFFDENGVKTKEL